MPSPGRKSRSFRAALKGSLALIAAAVLMAPLGCAFFRGPDEPRKVAVEPRPEPTPYEVLTSAERRARWKKKPQGSRTAPTPESQESFPASTPEAGRVPEVPAGPEPEAEDEVSPDDTLMASAAAVSPVDPARRDEVVRLYRQVYLPAVRTPVLWQGDLDRCDAGTESRASTEASRQMVNYFRTMAGLRGDIVFDPALNAKCRQAALSFLATPGLSHAIPRSWRCYSREGNEAAGRSNIALGYAGALAVTKYMEEPWERGFNLRHRQWILYSPTRRMGSGSVSGNGDRKNGYKGANALWVQPVKLGPKSPNLKWVAWPPRGYVPYPVVYRHWSVGPHIDERVDLRRASVTMWREDGELVPSRRGISTSPYAPDAAVAWIPEGLEFGPGMEDQTFEIEVRNVMIGGRAKNFRYSVTVIDPAA